MNTQNDLITIPTIEDVTRRHFISGALAAALLVACGDDDEAAPLEAATRIVTDMTGAVVEIPTRPERIVSLHQGIAGSLLSLGAPVVGVSGPEIQSHITDYFGRDALTLIAQDSGINYDSADMEAIAALNPDVIVIHGSQERGPSVNEGTLARLRAIAPVVAVNALLPDFHERLRSQAELLNLDMKTLEEQRAAHQVVLEKIRALLGDRWSEVRMGIANVTPTDDVFAYNQTSPQGLTLTFDMLGVSWPDLNWSDGGFLQLSSEQVREIECDLFVHFGKPSAELPQTVRQLGAVRAGQAILDYENAKYNGSHYPVFIDLAHFLLERLTAMMPIRTDIV